MKYHTHNHSGAILFQVLIFSTIALLFVGGLVAWAGATLRFGHNLYSREAALAVAEAGIEYYRWHLAHDSDDYQDGTGAPGPYIHEYHNAQGERIGEFSLDITPPPLGSSIVIIKSTGKLDQSPLATRTVEVTFAKPSLAQYAVAANADIRFGAGTEIFGKVHSNGGIRFDGLIHNLITSAKSSYDDPDHNDPPTPDPEEYGVHTHIAPTDPLPPAPVPNRTDVFEIGRTFPVPAIDFAGFTADYAHIKAQAQADGLYIPSSGALGWHLVLQTNDTIDIYRVNSTTPPPSNCTNSQNQSGWGTWSIQNETLVYNDTPIPSNGAIFVEDHAWVNGQIDGVRITIASARFPEDPATETSITINSNLVYTHYDGRDVISLMAQNNINTGLASANTIRIDAALIAKNGRVGRYYYRPPSGGQQRCSPYHQRTTITLYGMIATNKRYGFAYTDDTGYQNRIINYDPNLLYGPPPFFPQTTDQYERVSWKEL